MASIPRLDSENNRFRTKCELSLHYCKSLFGFMTDKRRKLAHSQTSQFKSCIRAYIFYDKLGTVVFVKTLEETSHLFSTLFNSQRLCKNMETGHQNLMINKGIQVVPAIKMLQDVMLCSELRYSHSVNSRRHQKRKKKNKT